MTFALPHLPPTQPTWEQWQIWWQLVIEAIQGQEAAQDQILTDLAAAQADIIATQTQLTETVRHLNIGLSYTAPSLVVSAVDAGTDATVTVANHTRIYGDGSQVAVTGGAFTGKAYSTTYAIYYDDPTLSDTTPTLVITTNIAEAQNNYADGRHFVATIATPAAAGAPTSGGTTPPGTGGGTGSGGGYTGGSGGGGVIP